MAEIINRQNYEVYLIDYLEGTLAPDLQADVQAFLQRNPDIEQMVDGIASMQLDAPALVYEHRAELRMVSHPEVGDMPELDYLCIAQMEGDLLPHESERLQQLELIEPTVVAVAMKAMARTKLVAEPCVYAHKSQFKRRAAGATAQWLWPVVASVAAAAVLVGVFVLGEGSGAEQPIVQSAELAQVDTPRVAPAVQPNASASTVSVDKPAKYVEKKSRQAYVAPRDGIAQAQLKEPEQLSEVVVGADEVDVAAELEIRAIHSIAAHVQQPVNFDDEHDVRRQMLADLNQLGTKGISPDEVVYDGFRRPLAVRLIQLAHSGVQRVERLVRFRGSVQRDKGGKVTSVKFEGEHLAVILPINRRESK